MNSYPEQKYSRPLLLAILLHVLVLSFLVFQLTLPVRSSGSSSSQPTIVHAVAVSQSSVDQYEKAIEQQAANQVAAQQAQLQKQIDAQQQAKAAAQQAQLQQQLQAQKAQLQASLQQQQLLKQQQLQQQVAEQQAAAEEAAKEAQVKKAAEQKAAAVAAVAKAKEQQQVSQLKQQLAQQMQSEISSDQATLDQNAAQSAQALGELNKYKALIIQAISQQWIIPQNLSNDLSCELDIRVAPGGSVINVTVAKSSGNPLLDNSAVAAVNKASPLPVPADPGMFDQFRELHLTVKPDGSMTSS